MPRELAQKSWQLPDLEPADLGPFGDFPRLADADKADLWRAFDRGAAERVPVTLGVNDRVLVLDPRFNDDRLTYADIFASAERMLIAQLRFQYLLRRRYGLFCDHPTELPDVWRVAPMFHNVYEAAGLGADVILSPDAVPDTRPWLTDDNKRAVFDIPIDQPLTLGVYPRGVELTEQMRDLAGDATFFDRPIEIIPYADRCSDGPLTVALNLRGPAIFVDLRRDPDYAKQLFAFIVDASLYRRRALLEHWSLPPEEELWFADDAVAMLSEAQYRDHILEHHRRWYDAVDPQRQMRRCMHLCGDATRHFLLMRNELAIETFDTGFPVDFAHLRQTLGPDVKITGGVDVATLLNANPETVNDRARDILTSGVLAGGRFVLREANNLPPAVPWQNLAAMYRAAFTFGALP